MIALAILAGVVFAAWRLLKRSRAGVLAGLDANKPTFHVEPPIRRLGSRKGEAL